MPERKPNRIARLIAVVALLGAFTAVAVLVASAGDSDDSEGRRDKGAVTTNEPTQEGERALERGFYVVRAGDTLAQIADNTGLELDQLEELNPTLDPQQLSPGEKVRLRQ
jgi:LysM repeat protein